MTGNDRLGYAAAAVGTSMMVPQVVKAFATHHMEDVSLLMAVLYILNCILWFIYSLRLRAKPMWIANAIGFCVGCTQFTLKIYWG